MVKRNETKREVPRRAGLYKITPIHHGVIEFVSSASKLAEVGPQRLLISGSRINLSVLFFSRYKSETSGLRLGLTNG